MVKTNCCMTGASGFVGSSVLQYLLEHTDWEFTCIASWRHKGSPLRITPNPRVTIVTHDLTGHMPAVGSFDYIINAASESSVDRSISDPVSVIENNVSSTLQVLEYARRVPPRVFIQFSTDEVFGTTSHAEEDVLLPSNPYAASKACQEMIAIAYWRTYGVPVVITNSNNIVGTGQDAEKFVPKLIEWIRNDDEVIIHTQNGRPGTRFYNPVGNVAAALLFILGRRPRRYLADVSSEMRANQPDRYILPGGKKLNNLEIARLVAGLLGKELKYKTVDVDSIRPGYDEFYTDTSGRLLELGFIPPVTLEEGLEWVKQYRARGTSHRRR